LGLKMNLCHTPALVLKVVEVQLRERMSENFENF
jgi:hypothetical protein